MKYALERIRSFLAGTDAFIQERDWLRGGPHHATLTMVGMAAGVPWEAPLLVALPMLGFYAYQMMEEAKPDAVTDFAFPLGVTILWVAASPLVALATLAIGTLAWWMVVVFSGGRADV